MPEESNATTNAILRWNETPVLAKTRAAQRRQRSEPGAQEAGLGNDDEEPRSGDTTVLYLSAAAFSPSRKKYSISSATVSTPICRCMVMTWPR